MDGIAEPTVFPLAVPAVTAWVYAPVPVSAIGCEKYAPPSVMPVGQVQPSRQPPPVLLLLTKNRISTMYSVFAAGVKLNPVTLLIEVPVMVTSLANLTIVHGSVDAHA